MLQSHRCPSSVRLHRRPGGRPRPTGQRKLPPSVVFDGPCESTPATAQNPMLENVFEITFFAAFFRYSLARVNLEPDTNRG